MGDISSMPPLANEAWATQYGTRSQGFSTKPKTGQTALSLSEGQRDLAFMCRAVGAANRKNKQNQGVRFARVGDLRSAGFLVCRDPIHPDNPEHLVVQFLADWGENEERVFDECFIDPVWGE